MTRTLAAIALRRASQPYNVVLAVSLVLLCYVAFVGMSTAEAISAQAHRAAMRTLAGPDGVMMSAQRTDAGREPFTLVVVWDRDRAAQHLDVAAERLPSAGTSSVSPALATRLLEDAADAVEARVPGEERGIVSNELLLSPDEAVAFATMSSPDTRPEEVLEADGAPTSLMGLLVVMALLLVPSTSVVLVAARFDGASRHRVLTDLRALGVPRRGLLLLSALESCVLVAAAVPVAALLWLATRSTIASTGVLGSTFFSADLAVPPTGILLVGAVLLVMVFTVSSGLSEEAGEAQGEDPHADGRARRGPLALVVGVVGIHVTAAIAPLLTDVQLGVLEVTCFALTAYGLARSGPHLLRALGRWLARRRDAGLAGLLAGRRLQAAARQSFRSAVAVVALAFVFGGFAALDLAPLVDEAGDHDHDEAPGRDAEPPDGAATMIVDLNTHPPELLEASLQGREVPHLPVSYSLVEDSSLLAMATCERLADVGVGLSRSCDSGRAYRTAIAEHRPEGSRIDLGGEATFVGEAVEVAGRVSNSEAGDLWDGVDAIIAVTAEQLRLAEVDRVFVRADDDEGELLARSIAAESAPLAQVRRLGAPGFLDDGLEAAGTVGRVALVGGLLLAGAALAVASADAALRRRETSALLFATGVPRRTRISMVAFEVGVPLVVATLPAVFLGFEMVYVGGSIIGGDVRVPWADLALAVLGITAVVLLVVATTMAFVARLPTLSLLQSER